MTAGPFRPRPLGQDFTPSPTARRAHVVTRCNANRPLSAPYFGPGNADIGPGLDAVGLRIAERELARKLLARWMPSEYIMLVH